MGGVLEGLKDGEDSGVAVAGPVGGHQTVGLGLAVYHRRLFHPASVSQDDALLGLLEGGVHVG